MAAKKIVKKVVKLGFTPPPRLQTQGAAPAIPPPPKKKK